MYSFGIFCMSLLFSEVGGRNGIAHSILIDVRSTPVCQIPKFEPLHAGDRITATTTPPHQRLSKTVKLCVKNWQHQHEMTGGKLGCVSHALSVGLSSFKQYGRRLLWRDLLCLVQAARQTMLDQGPRPRTSASPAPARSPPSLPNNTMDA